MTSEPQDQAPAEPSVSELTIEEVAGELLVSDAEILAYLA